MSLQYVRKIEPDLRGDFSGRCFIVVVTLVLSGAQYCGLEIVGVSSNLIIVTTMLPFVVLVIWGVPKMDWGQVVAEKEGEVDWALLLTNLFWNLNYCECHAHDTHSPGLIASNTEQHTSRGLGFHVGGRG